MKNLLTLLMCTTFLSCVLRTPAVVDGQDHHVLLNSGLNKDFPLKSITKGEIISTSGEKLSIESVESIHIRQFSRPKEQPFTVFATQNTEIRCGEFQITDGNLNVSLGAISDIGIPRTSLRSIKLDQSISEQEWNKQMRKSIQSDALVVNRSGKLESITGTIKKLSQLAVEFETRGRTASVEIQKLAGILFFQPPDAEPSPKVVITDRLGNRFGGRQVSLESSKLSVLVSDDHSIDLPIESVASINFGIGRYRWLETMEPQSSTWEPFLKSKVQDPDIAKLLQLSHKKKVFWTKNSAFGTPLAIESVENRSKENPTGKQVFARGIAVKGGSRIVYSIPDKTQEFLATVGIQANEGRHGTVKLILEVDGKTLYSNTLTGMDEKVQSLRLPCNGNRLIVSVSCMEDGDVGDILVLGNARFRKSQ